MIPRYQRVLFWLLAGASLVMVLVLLRGCEQAHRRLSAPSDSTPIAPPAEAVAEDITLLIASDREGSITSTDAQLSLPKESTTRAREILNALLATYTQHGSSHPLPPGPAVDDVFILGAPRDPAHPDLQTSTGRVAITIDPIDTSATANETAVVNLDLAFADHHPSGVEAETLTIQSILGTLHANFPDITRVRFLVGGQPRDTLSGHADLLTVYRVADTTFKPTTPVEDDSEQ